MGSDNGPQVIAAEFFTFMKQNGIKHIRCSPYHPGQEACENENLSLELTYCTDQHLIPQQVNHQTSCFLVVTSKPDKAFASRPFPIMLA